MTTARLANLLSLIKESSEVKLISENFGNLAPLITRIGPVLAVPFTRQTGVLRSIGQNSTYESPEKINYSNLRKMIAGEIKLKGGEPLAGIVVYLGPGVPVLSIAWAKYKSSYGSDYKVLYNYDEQAIFDLLNADNSLAAGSSISSGATDIFRKIWSTNTKMSLPYISIGTPIGSAVVGVVSVGKPNMKGREAFSRIEALPKIIGDCVQNFVKLFSELAYELNGQKLTFSIVGIGVDQNMKTLQKDRASSMTGVVPLPSDKNYKDYIKNLSTQFAAKLNKFKVDKLTPSLKSLPVQDFQDPEKLANLIKSSKLFDQELVQIGDFRYKLRKLESGGPGWENSDDKKGLPSGTVISKLEFEYRVVDSDEEKINKIRRAAYDSAMGITPAERSNEISAVTPPTSFQGVVLVYINLLNLSDTRIKVTKLTNHNW